MARKVLCKEVFLHALKDVRAPVKLLLQEIDELHVSEAEIKFGMDTVRELGNMAIGKVGVGMKKI